jgi:hypothetical protein
MPENEISNLMRTLLASGFEVTTVDRKPNYLALHLLRTDEFGIDIRYVLAYAGDSPISTADAEGLRKVAKRDGSALVVVSSANKDLPADLVVLSKPELLGKIGGVVSSVLPLEPEYGEQLKTLGQNKLPEGLAGKPDDLFEGYVHAGLQFLLRGRVIRYGQERRFEAVPDGLMLSTKAPLMLYDCKAAGTQYELSRSAIRQFADYVNQFHSRYAEHVGRMHAFVVVSYAFQAKSVLMERSNSLYSQCSVPLVCVTAASLAEMVSLFADRPIYRTTVDWKEIFVPPLLIFQKVKEAVEARQRDQVIRE